MKSEVDGRRPARRWRRISGSDPDRLMFIGQLGQSRTGASPRSAAILPSMALRDSTTCIACAPASTPSWSAQEQWPRTIRN